MGNNTAGGSSPRSGCRWGWTPLRPRPVWPRCAHHVLMCPSAPPAPGGSLPPTRPTPLGRTPPWASFSYSHKFSHSGAGLRHMNLGGGGGAGHRGGPPTPAFCFPSPSPNSASIQPELVRKRLLCALTNPAGPTRSEPRARWTRPCGAPSFTKDTPRGWSPGLTGTAVRFQQQVTWGPNTRAGVPEEPERGPCQETAGENPALCPAPRGAVSPGHEAAWRPRPFPSSQNPLPRSRPPRPWPPPRSQPPLPSSRPPSRGQ